MSDPIANLKAMLEEPLCEELEACMGVSPSGIPVLSHPLVHMLAPVLGGHANRMLEAKREEIGKALMEGRFSTIVFLYEKPYRMLGLRRLHEDGHLTDGKILAELFHDVWITIENVWQCHEDVDYLLPFLDRSTLHATGGNFIDTLPETVTVYRGHHHDNTFGMSWTTSRETAEWFARRYSKEGAVEELVVKKRDILFATDERNEKEVVLPLDME